jgi:hypothetical protein
VGLVSAALVLLSPAGIYSWFKLHGERRIGSLLLGLSLGGSLAVAVLIRAA